MSSTLPEGPGAGLVGEARVPKLAVHALLVAIPVWVATLFFNGELFGFHATFMSLGFMLFMSEGVWLASRAVVLPAGEDRLSLLKLHMYAQIMALVCIGIGFFAIYRNKQLHGKPHFTSYHGLAGAVVLTATAAVPVGGALAFKQLGLMRHAPEMRLALIKALHRKAGALTYFAATLVVMLGLCTPAIHQGSQTYILVLLTSLAGGLVFNVYYAKLEEGFVPLATRGS
jgi:cytochrome b-561 domain-containing protein 2